MPKEGDGSQARLIPLWYKDSQAGEAQYNGQEEAKVDAIWKVLFIYFLTIDFCSSLPFISTGLFSDLQDAMH
jgi:hypothetical protein